MMKMNGKNTEVEGSGLVKLVVITNVFNPFVPRAPFLYSLKTENLTFFWCFQEVEKKCIGNEWVNQHHETEINRFIYIRLIKSNVHVNKICTYHIRGCHFWSTYRVLVNKVSN